MSSFKKLGYALISAGLLATARAARDNTGTQTGPDAAPASYTMYYVIGGVVLLVVIAFLAMRKKKQ